MPVLTSKPPKAARDAEIEDPKLNPDYVDFVPTTAATPMSGETFEEELLRDALLPRDGEPRARRGPR